MGLEYWPDFSLIAEGKDITAVIKRGVNEIRFTDNGAATKKSDELQITLTSETLALPAKGAKLQLGLGFNGALVNKGTFTVCQVQSSGPPRRISIYATAAPMNAGKHGADVTCAKTRTFDDITLGDLVKTIAADNGLTAQVAESLASIKLDYVQQSAESDASLLSRMAMQYGAVSKVTNDRWLFLEFGAGQSAGGRELPSVTVTPEMVSTWNYSEGDRGTASKTAGVDGKAGVRYHDAATGETVIYEVDVESSSQIYPYTKPTQTTAKKLAEAQVDRVQQAGRKMSLTMPVRPTLLNATAESGFVTQGFGVREDHSWRAESLSYSLSQSGFTLQVSLATDISKRGGNGGGGDGKSGDDYFSK